MPVSTSANRPPAGTHASGSETEGLKAFWAWLFTAKGLGVVATGLLVVWAGYLLLWNKVPDVCRDEVSSSDIAKTPSDLVVQVCEPMTATDPRVFLFLFVVLLLLLPWFSEVEVAGLFRVKKQLAEAEKDVDGLRESVRTAQAQVATLTATVTATTTSQASNQTNVQFVVDPRGAESAQSQQVVLAGNDEAPFTEGAFAQTAFKAGLVGLHTLFPPDRTPFAMMFFTWGHTLLEMSQSIGDVDPDLAIAADQLADPAEAFASIQSHGVLVTAPAFDDDGSTVGAVVAAFRDQQLLEDHEPLFADLENVASAYARLLVDLLGETGRLIPSTDDVEGGP